VSLVGDDVGVVDNLVWSGGGWQAASEQGEEEELAEDIDEEAKLVEDTLGLAKATGSTVLLAFFPVLAQLTWL